MALGTESTRSHPLGMEKMCVVSGAREFDIRVAKVVNEGQDVVMVGQMG